MILSECSSSFTHSIRMLIKLSVLGCHRTLVQSSTAPHSPRANTPPEAPQPILAFPVSQWRACPQPRLVAPRQLSSYAPESPPSPRKIHLMGVFPLDLGTATPSRSSCGWVLG